MTTPTPPPAPGAPVVIVEKKSGMGCFGCGCLILLVLLVLFLGLAGGISYWAYNKASAFTSPAASTVKTFDGGDDLYHAATQKLSDFDQASQHHQPATLQLSADEINTLIARDHDFADNNIHVFVTMTDDKADVQISFPANALQLNLFKGRYINGESSFGINFDAASKTLDFIPSTLRLGDQEVPKDLLPTLQSELVPVINQLLQGDPEGKVILDQAKSIEIKNSLLTIEIE
jgi:hypothetical protein